MSERLPAPLQQPSADTLPERRAFVRLASDLAATCRPESAHDPAWPGSVRDISRGGVGLILRHRFRPGTVIEVELRDSAGRALRTVRARVVHATASLIGGAHCWLLGCAFDRPLGEEEFGQLT